MGNFHLLKQRTKYRAMKEAKKNGITIYIKSLAFKVLEKSKGKITILTSIHAPNKNKEQFYKICCRRR